MRVGIMQPYFFPNLPHFGLINATDEWIVFDTPQYTRKSWVNRNRILHPTKDWQYISVPLAHSTIHMRINQARVADIRTLHTTILGKLSHYRKCAPNYFSVLRLVNKTFEDVSEDLLVSLNVSGLNAVCDYLGIPFNWRLCSKLKLVVPEQMRPGDWAPFISKNIGASSYINPVGGRELFDVSDFSSNGIQFNSMRFGEFTYKTPGYKFIPGLSILDVLMWNSPEQVRTALLHHTQLEG